MQSPLATFASFLLAASLGGCFQTEPGTADLLSVSRIEYGFSRSGCGIRERISVRVPASAAYDSATLCVAGAESGIVCRTFHTAGQGGPDTLDVDFLLDQPRYVLICSTYSRNRLRADSMGVEAGGLMDSLVLPESLYFHIGRETLRYGYELRNRRYVSRSLVGLELSAPNLSEGYPKLVFLGPGIDSLTLGGRMPPPPFTGLLSVKPVGGMGGDLDTLDLSHGGKILIPEDRPAELHFQPFGPESSCGTVERSPEDAGEEGVLFLSHFASVLRLSRDASVAPQICPSTGACSNLEWAR